MIVDENRYELRFFGKEIAGTNATTLEKVLVSSSGEDGFSD
jgi:hypothetical protein